jgi:hypothetical protein
MKGEDRSPSSVGGLSGPIQGAGPVDAPVSCSKLGDGEPDARRFKETSTEYQSSIPPPPRGARLLAPAGGAISPLRRKEIADPDALRCRLWLPELDLFTRSH